MEIAPTVTRPTPTAAQLSTRSTQEMAVEFESLLTSELLKQMRSTTGEGGLFPGDDSDTLGGMFDMYFGRFLAENGGIGIADHIAGQLPG